MTITSRITFDDPVGITVAEKAALSAFIDLALARWSAVLSGSAVAGVQVEIVDDASLRAGTSVINATNVVQLANGLVVGEGALNTQLRSGVHPNAAAPDIKLQISIDYLRNELWFDPTPDTAGDIPRDRIDALSVIIHELGHGLGFIGYGEAQDGPVQSPYDLRVAEIEGAPYFTGPNAKAVLGRDVPLTPGNYAHYGLSNAFPGTANDPLTGLMNGVVYYRGYRYAIGDLDIAMMADLGLGTIRDDIYDETWLANIDGGPGTDIFKADYSARTEGLRVVRDLNGDLFIPSSVASLASVHLRNVERLDIKLGSGNDQVAGGVGDDRIDGGAGADVMTYAAASTNFTWAHNPDGSWTVRDLRPTGGEGVDTLINVESLKFSDKTVALTVSAAQAAVDAILRGGGAPATELDARVAAGTLTTAGAIAEVVKTAAATTSVASMSYQFFTGKVPSQAGVDFLVSPTGPNTTNLNSAYYAKFDTVNRYINFAVNLGKNGEAKDSFAAKYGSLSLIDATEEAYKAIFGASPTDAKAHALIDTRIDYLAYYGGDGADGIGTKAAMVGFLLAAAATEDVGALARSNDAWLTDLSDGVAPFAVNILDPAKGYWKADFVFGG